MPSIIPGFEYDIFISYRHKDNKYDGWVTHFVENLKKELEATFKETISVYFDSNRDDGLLETHNVDLSLSSKIKSLILIPVLSQTYCDINSFAWKNEFIAFNALSLHDNFGREIKLSNGNVSNRILPVKIHELDTADERMIYDIMNCQLRSIEFIYQLPGVNRPLTPEDDGRENNPYFYRDQINKMANACKEIITGMKIARDKETGTNGQADLPSRKEAPEKNKEERPQTTDRQLSFRVKVIQQVSIFSFLSPKLLETVASKMQSINLGEGEIVVEKGEQGSSMFIIVDGRVKVHDKDHVFGFLSGGEFFGEYAVLDKEERSASVTAVEPTILYRLDQDVFQELINSNPQFSKSVLQVLVKRLRKLDAMQQELASSYQRISENNQEIKETRNQYEEFKKESNRRLDTLRTNYEEVVNASLDTINQIEVEQREGNNSLENTKKLKETLQEIVMAKQNSK